MIISVAPTGWDHRVRRDGGRESDVHNSRALSSISLSLSIDREIKRKAYGKSPVVLLYAEGGHS
jgi:hypothetical protein